MLIVVQPEGHRAYIDVARMSVLESVVSDRKHSLPQHSPVFLKKQTNPRLNPGAPQPGHMLNATKKRGEKHNPALEW